MPYIIETSTPRYHSAFGREVPHLTHTAVATLEEARSIAHATVHESYRVTYPLKPRGLGGEHSDAQRAHRWHNVDVDKLPESGGTIGPLPDGTVIEVRHVSWAALDNLTWGSTRRLRNPETIGAAEVATLSHFNSREAHA